MGNEINNINFTSLRFYFILDDDLKLVHNETTKVCNALTYSEGGHILAAANGN